VSFNTRNKNATKSRRTQGGAELPRPDQGVRGKKRQRNVSSFVLLDRLDADTRVVAMVTVGFYVDTEEDF